LVAVEKKQIGKVQKEGIAKSCFPGFFVLEWAKAIITPVQGNDLYGNKKQREAYNNKNPL
jgi:hypothetical protein